MSGISLRWFVRPQDLTDLCLLWHWFRCIGRIEPFRGKDYGIIDPNTMRAGLNAKITHSAFLSQNFVTSDEKRILRISGSASFLASYPTEPVPNRQRADTGEPTA